MIVSETVAGPRACHGYVRLVGDSYAVTVDDRGRVVLPVQIRDAAGIDGGTRLVLLPTPTGLVLMTRDQLRQRVREDLAGLDLVTDLLADRRRSSD